jgi:hypothetical protein
MVFDTLLQFIRDPYDQLAHVSYFVDLLFSLEAVQTNLPVDALECLLTSVDVGNVEAVMC